MMFAIGRMPGWIANYKEIMEDTNEPHLPPAPDLHGRAAGKLRADQPEEVNGRFMPRRGEQSEANELPWR